MILARKGQDLVLFLVKCCERPLLKTNTFRAVGYVDSKAAVDIAIVLLYKLVDLHYVGAVLGVVILLTTAANVSDKQAVTAECAGGITKHTNADTAFLRRSVLVLAGDQGSVCIVYILNEGLVDRKADHGIVGGEDKGGRRCNRTKLVAFIASEQSSAQADSGY